MNFLPTKNIFILCLLFFFCNTQTYAQPAPGGVNSSLKLWHRASDISPVAAGSLTQDWPPAFGYGNPSTLFSSGSNPNYQISDGFNYNTAVVFKNECFKNNDIDINKMKAVTVFTVYKPVTNNDAPVWGNGKNSHDSLGRQLRLHTLNNGTSNRGDYDHEDSSKSQKGLLYINQVVYKDVKNIKTVLYINGKNAHIKDSSNVTGNLTASQVDSQLYIGASGEGQVATPNDIDIEIAEFIVYEGILSEAERKFITSYLAIKYGLTLPYSSTSPYDYQLANGDVAWNTLGGAYNNNIVGVAYDADPNKGNGALKQEKSTSQRPGDYLTLSTDTAAFFHGTDRRSLLVGHDSSATDVAKTLTPKAGSKVSSGHRIGRVWRAQTTGTYSDYTLAFDGRLPLPSLFNGKNKHLIVADDANFTTNVRSHLLVYANGAYSVSGVDFGTKTVKFFSIGIENFYTNNDAGAPANFEACYGSSVTFYYDNWTNAPDSVILNSINGGYTSITGSDLQVDPTTKTVTFTIPDTAATGFVTFMDSSNILHTTQQALIIHNPVVDFLPQVAPLCATDSIISLYGFPKGGTFSMLDSNLAAALTADTLDATKLRWGSLVHDLSKNITIIYSYTAKYSDGSLCKTPKKVDKDFIIYDNRLTSLSFNPYVKKRNSSNLIKLTLDSNRTDNLINKIEPNILHGSTAPHYTYNFSGTFVKNDSIFLANNASSNDSIILQLNNNGCIGEITGALDVYQPLSIGGLPDTLCNDADSIHFYSDSTLTYLDTIISGIRSIKNKIVNVSTTDSNQASSITIVNNTPGAYKYAFHPRQLVGPAKVAIRIKYSNTVTDNNSTISDTFQVIETVVITQRPVISLAGLESAYCNNDNTPDTIIPSPKFEYPSRTYFTLVGQDSAGLYNLPSSVFQDSLIIPDTIYRALVPSSNRDLPIRLTYTVDRYGCKDSTNYDFTIRAPKQPTITLDKTARVPNDTLSICATNTPLPILGSQSRGFFKGKGIFQDSLGGWYFKSSPSDTGLRLVTYTTKTGQGLVCTAEQTLNINIRPLPSLKFLTQLDNHFCSNDIFVKLPSDTLNPVWHSFLDTTSGGVSITTSSVFVQQPNGSYHLVSDTSYYFSPDSVGPGTYPITYTAIDPISHCQNSRELTYKVEEYINLNIGIDSSYCASDSPIRLMGIPPGGGFYRNDSLLNPDPNKPYPYFEFDKSRTTSILDTLTYKVTYGACQDSLTKIIKTSPISNISFKTINHPHNTYCLGGDDVFLQANVGGTLDSVRGTFDGSPGVLAGKRTFVPDLAGVGSHVVTFEYEDASTPCPNIFSDTLHVYEMPNLDFSVVGGCQYDSVHFHPNNSVLGLDNIAQSGVIDSIISVKWVFDSTTTAMGSTNSSLVYSNLINPITHIYDSAGIYMTKLIVANHKYCIDTQTVRLVVSPKVTVTPSLPYVQDFENTKGNWFPESRDNGGRDSLWQWGADNNPKGILANPNNNIWATKNDAAYKGGEDAWIYSPCFDLTDLKRPMVSLDYWTDTRTSVDGAVLEYQRADNTWAPLGLMNRGVNWFNSPFISGQPGDQSLLGTGWEVPLDWKTPLGWSGRDSSWQNGRYKLDNFKDTNNILRMRIAFASPDIQLNKLFYDGFAFDNFVVCNRTRNVLLETMVNIGYTGMEKINNDNDTLVHHTSLNKDVVLLKYHIDGKINDPIYQNNPSLGRTRAYEYGAAAGQAFIDGDDSTKTYMTNKLKTIDFEKDMLASPKFAISIDKFTHKNNNFNIRAIVTALDSMPKADYRIYTVISEDELSYPTGTTYPSKVHAVARENDQFHLNASVNTTQIYSQPWTTDSTVTINFNWNHAPYNFIVHKPGHFHAVVFIQDIDTKEVFQVATTRNVSGYFIVGIDPIAAEQELNEIQNVNLFPNPAHDYFNLKFEQTLKTDFQWKLVDLRGVEVKQGQVAKGTEQFTIDGLDCPSGTYVLVIYNDKVFTQRKVVLGRP